MKSFVVIGMGRFGRYMAITLYELGYEVMVLDKDPEIIQEMSRYVTHAVVANSTDEVTLQSLGVRNFDVAIVAVGSNIEVSILTTVMLKDLGVKRVLVKGNSDIHTNILKKIGADEVVFPEKEMGIRTAYGITQSNIVDYINLSDEYSILEVKVPRKWSGKTIEQLNLRAKFGINVIAIKQKNGLNVSPSAKDQLNQEDLLVVVGSNEELEVLHTQI